MFFAVNLVETAFAPGAALRAMSEPLRLRILALLEAEELSVGELSRALGLSQSRVSNHLRVLREAALLRERHAGTSTYLRLAAPRPGRAEGGLDVAARLWAVLRGELDLLPERDADRVRLDAVLAERAGDGGFFDRVAGEWDKIAGAFESGLARERAAGHLLPAGYTVADLGCGTGYMGAALLGRCARLVCVDQSEAMLAAAGERLAKHPRGTAIELRQGPLDRLPLADGEVDAVVVGLVLHHLDELDRPLAEMQRVLRPGGTLAVLELAPHGEGWMRAELGDRHLGLEAKDVLAALGRAGFVDLVLDPALDRYQPRRAGAAPGEPARSLDLYLVRGRRPRA